MDSNQIKDIAIRNIIVSMKDDGINEILAVWLLCHTFFIHTFHGNTTYTMTGKTVFYHS